MLPAKGNVAVMAGIGLLCLPNSGQGGATQAQLASWLTTPSPEFRVADDRPDKPVIALEIHRFYASDAVLNRLKSFPELEELTFIEDGRGLATGSHAPWRVTDAGVLYLKELKHLRSLTLPSSEITDAGIAHLAEMPHLHKLGIGNGNGYDVSEKPNRRRTILDDRIVANITNTAIPHLSKLRDLKHLEIYGTRITDEGFKGLTGLSQLRSLSLRFLDGGITERALASVGRFSKLASLDVADLRDVREPFDTSLAELRGLTELESLSIFSLRVTDAGLAHLGGMTQLRRLRLYHAFATMPVTDAGLEHLRGLTQLRSLTLGIRRMSDKGLQVIAGLKALERFEVSSFTTTTFTDEGLLQLRTLKALGELRIPRGTGKDGFKVTDRGIEALSKELPAVHFGPPR